jgi:two-component system, NtrC family, sensor kinase
VRAQRQALNSLYRARYDQVSMTSMGLSIVGMLVFGALLLLFLTRLGWDLKRLQERALAVVKGYRGPALPVTRGDEIGALMRSVNRMQEELLQHEARVEMARSQQFHHEKMAAVGALAAQIAHEINNPIAAITGIAEAICDLRRRGAPCQLHTGCEPEFIVQQARRVAAITRQISEFSSPQAEERQLLDLNALIENTCAFARYDARLRKLQLDLALDRQLPAVNAVGDHLTQVLMNLLMNAADAIADARVQGRIRIATAARAGEIVLTVTDNGAGMSEATRQRAFDEFFTTKPKGHGCGIGLALSRRLLREAGADIDLESKPGCGTVVTVRLPLTNTNEIAARAARIPGEEEPCKS